jgi:hypothetical protein
LGAVVPEEIKLNAVSVVEAGEDLIPLGAGTQVDLADDEFAHGAEAIARAAGQQGVQAKVELGAQENAEGQPQQQQVQEEPKQNLGIEREARHDVRLALRRPAAALAPAPDRGILRRAGRRFMARRG